MQALIVGFLVLIVASLGHALSSLASGPEKAALMAQALTMRISLSIALFVLLLVGYHFGWIAPHAVH